MKYKIGKQEKSVTRNKNIRQGIEQELVNSPVSSKWTSGAALGTKLRPSFEESIFDERKPILSGGKSPYNTSRFSLSYPIERCEGCAVVNVPGGRVSCFSFCKTTNK